MVKNRKVGTASSYQKIVRHMSNAITKSVHNRGKLIQAGLLGSMVICLMTTTAEAQKVVQTAAGYYHSLFLKSDGSLWAMGADARGQLGDGHYLTNAPYGTNQPELIVSNSVTAIAAGAYHSLFLKSDGSLWAMGYNNAGQLGDGTFIGTNRPEMIVASNVTAIAAGAFHSLFLKSDSSLWGMGANDEGQLGDGSYATNSPYYGTNQPELLASNVLYFAAGGHHSLFVKTDGSLWAMGDNSSGQLGNGTYNNTNVPVQVALASNVTAVAAGDYHSLFVTSDHKLWGMGYNFNGQLGDGTFANTDPYGTNQPELLASNVTQIAVGPNHSLFIKNDQTLWGMGYNLSGQLGDGTYSLTGPNYGINQPEMVAGSVTDGAGGQSHSLFVKNDGSLWGMGDNSYGQLGSATYSATNRPQLIIPGIAGYFHLSAQLLNDGAVRLSFVGDANADYALDRTFCLSPADWMPQMTNTANSFGNLSFTNTPDPSTNNFWRVRFVP